MSISNKLSDKGVQNLKPKNISHSRGKVRFYRMSRFNPSRNSYNAALALSTHVSQAFQPDLEFADQHVVITQGADSVLGAQEEKEAYRFEVPVPR